MSEQAYLVKGTAKIRLSGKAQIIGIDGVVLQHIDLSDAPEVQIDVSSYTSICKADQCGITFTIDDVFALVGKGVLSNESY